MPWRFNNVRNQSHPDYWNYVFLFKVEWKRMKSPYWKFESAGIARRILPETGIYDLSLIIRKQRTIKTFLSGGRGDFRWPFLPWLVCPCQLYRPICWSLSIKYCCFWMSKTPSARIKLIIKKKPEVDHLLVKLQFRM